MALKTVVIIWLSHVKVWKFVMLLPTYTELTQDITRQETDSRVVCLYPFWTPSYQCSSTQS